MKSEGVMDLRVPPWDFAQFPYDPLWACRSDGALLGLTYLKEQQVQM